MDRSGDRRTGTDRRRRAEMFLPWQEPDWVLGDGIERRSGERRSGADRRRHIAGQPSWYSDDWARARGARGLCEWLDRCAGHASIGLPEDWHPAA